MSYSGTLTGNISISATPAIKSTAKVVLNQPSQYQVIHFYTLEGGQRVDHTTSFTCDTGLDYEIQVVTDMWWKAGKLNVPNKGKVEKDMSISVGEPSIQTDYEVGVTISSTYRNGIKGYGFNTNDGIGSVDQEYITDGFMIYDPSIPSYGVRSYFYFWGASSVEGLFKSMTCIIEYGDGQQITICNNIPNDSFDMYGDIYDLPEWDQDLFELLKLLEGQKVTFKLHIEV